MRVFDAQTAAALGADNLPAALLVEMDLATPLRLTSAGQNVTFNGVEYLGVGTLGQVGTTQESPNEVKQLALTISGVPEASVSQALQERVNGRAVRVKLAILHPDTYQPLDVRQRWAGRLDTFTLADSGDAAAGQASISVNAEHAGIDLIRPSTVRYTDADQRRLHPGDLAFQYVSAQSDMRVVWPSAAWGRK